jgi:hypothetical protein
MQCNETSSSTNSNVRQGKCSRRHMHLLDKKERNPRIMIQSAIGSFNYRIAGIFPERRQISFPLPSIQTQDRYPYRSIGFFLRTTRTRTGPSLPMYSIRGTSNAGIGRGRDAAAAPRRLRLHVMASGRADAGGNVTLGIVMRSRQKCKYAVFSAGGLRCVTLQDWTSDLESNSRARAGWKHHQLAVATIPKFVSQVGSACHRRSEARLLSLDGHFCHLLSQERHVPLALGPAMPVTLRLSIEVMGVATTMASGSCRR